MNFGEQKPCTKCGKSCRTKSGMCRECMNGERMPNLAHLTVEQLVFIREGAISELKRRREAINAALEGT